MVKPPEIAPFGALRFAELALEAGLRPGVLNVVVGAAAGDALVRHRGIDKVSFTGGGATARLVMAAAAETLTPLTFELGGKSANIVFPDADLDAATSMAAMLGAVLLSGQGCALPTRLYVHDDVYDEVEVVAKANDSPFGLSAYVHTRDSARAQRMARGLEVGTVVVNGFPGMSPGAPFGGVKQSGFGREGGRAGIEEFVRRKNVVFG